MKVLIALDHSSASRHAAHTAAELFSGAEFLVLNVAQIPIVWAGVGGGFGAVAALQIDALGAVDETQQAKAIEEDARSAGVPVADVEVASGDVVHEICDVAERHEVDLIVVGSHDRPLLARLFEPSVSRGVVRSSGRPVLVVPAPPEG
jgi:nucleotide-binding universal stress UspA family protein